MIKILIKVKTIKAAEHREILNHNSMIHDFSDYCKLEKYDRKHDRKNSKS